MASWLPWIQPLLQIQLLQCNLSPMYLWNQSIPNPRNQQDLGGGTDYDSIYKEIDTEDVGGMILCGWLAAMDSAPNPNLTSLMHFLQCRMVLES